MLKQIVSGGQTGVDRAALDVALELGIECGGWCPKGRKAEDGYIGLHYPLKDTPLEDYAQRTEWNVQDSDGTLILTMGEPSGGTAVTIEVAGRLGKPCLIIDLGGDAPSASSIHSWTKEHNIRILNVAGPRESKATGIYIQAGEFLREVLSVMGKSA